MAGSYPDAPSRRMAYDSDGTVLLTANQSNFGGPAGTAPSVNYTIISQQNAENMNDETYSTGFSHTNNNQNSGHWFTLLYPQKREFDGAFLACSLSGGGDVTNEAYSTDTSNGLEGVWTDLTQTWIKTAPAVDDYRDMIISYAVSNVLSHMFTLGADDNQNYRMVHIYGAITPGETPDRLIFLDPDAADTEFTKPLDFGDVPRGQTQVDTVKVKNNSSTLTANTVSVTAEDLSDGSSSWYTFSTDDISYSASEDIGSIGNGGTQLVYVKQVVPDAQGIGVYAARLKATVASWS